MKHVFTSSTKYNQDLGNIIPAFLTCSKNRKLCETSEHFSVTT